MGKVAVSVSFSQRTSYFGYVEVDEDDVSTNAVVEAIYCGFPEMGIEEFYRENSAEIEDLEWQEMTRS